MIWWWWRRRRWRRSSASHDNNDNDDDDDDDDEDDYKPTEKEGGLFILWEKERKRGFWEVFIHYLCKKELIQH